MAVLASCVVVPLAVVVVVVIVAAVTVTVTLTLGKAKLRRAVAFCRSTSRQERKVLLYALETHRARRSQMVCRHRNL